MGPWRVGIARAIQSLRNISDRSLVCCATAACERCSSPPVQPIDGTGGPRTRLLERRRRTTLYQSNNPQPRSSFLLRSPSPSPSPSPRRPRPSEPAAPRSTCSSLSRATPRGATSQACWYSAGGD